MNRLFPSALFSIALFVAAPANSQDFQPVAGWDNQLFPSYLLSTAELAAAGEDVADAASANDSDGSMAVLGDATGLIGIELKSTADQQPVSVALRCDELFEPTEFKGTLPEAGRMVRINPRVVWKTQALTTITKPVTVNVSYIVRTGNTGRPVQKTMPVTIRAVSECPYTVHLDGEAIDTSYTFAGFVNEDHPAVESLIRSALERGTVKSFSGYEYKDDGEVIRQVYAIWDALTANGLKVTRPEARSATTVVNSLPVRTVDQSLSAKQISNVDGAVLMASALRRIGLETFLVMVPGHCYVGFYVEETQDSLLAIEMTLLGSAAGRDGGAPSFESLDESVSKELRNPASWPSFASAVVEATNSIEQNADKLMSADEPEYLMVDLTEARAMGIRPIPVTGRTVVARKPPLTP